MGQKIMIARLTKVMWTMPDQQLAQVDALEEKAAPLREGKCSISKEDSTALEKVCSMFSQYREHLFCLLHGQDKRASQQIAASGCTEVAHKAEPSCSGMMSCCIYVSFYNNAASTWTFATPRATWESVLPLRSREACVPGPAWPTIAWPDMFSSSVLVNWKKGDQPQLTKNGPSIPLRERRNPHSKSLSKVQLPT